MHLLTHCCQGMLLVAAAALLPVLGSPQHSPFVAHNKFEDIATYRTNVCERQRLFWQDELDLPDALRGLNLTVAITNYQSGNEKALFTLVDGKIKDKNPGLFAVILDELAKRAGFTWRDSFAAFPPLEPDKDGNKTWTDLLEWHIQNFDVSMDYWGKSAERMSLGVSFPEGWFPGTVILVASVDPADDTIVRDIWSFLTPFTWDLWIMIIVAIVVTGVTYWAFEQMNSKTDKRGAGRLPFSSIYLSAITFTGHFNFWPGTSSAQILTFSCSVWALIVMSSYTANMASFLVARTQKVFPISTIDDALALDASVCILGGTYLHAHLEDRYPQLKLVPKATEQDTFLSLGMDPADGGCQVAATQEGVFDTYERTRAVNPKCFLRSEKRIVLMSSAGMATTVDTGTMCTSLISSVLDYHLFQMRDDGFFNQAWNEHVSKIADIECVDDRNLPAAGGSDPTFSLNLADMGGIFILHAISSVVAILLAAMQYYFPGMTGKRDGSNGSRRISVPRSSDTVYDFSIRGKTPAPILPPQTESSKEDLHDLSLRSEPEGVKFNL